MREIQSNNEMEGVLVLSGRVARRLLRKGYQIIDIKPDKNIAIKTIFVFKVENDIRKAIADIAYAE